MCSCTFCPTKKRTEVLFHVIREIIYSKCILSTVYLINCGYIQDDARNPNCHEITTIVPQLITLAVDPKTILYKRLPFLILPFILRLVMPLDMKDIKRYCKVWCLRFEGASAESSEMLHIPNYLTPYKVLHICFNSLVTVLPFSFVQIPRSFDFRTKSDLNSPSPHVNLC